MDKRKDSPTQAEPQPHSSSIRGKEGTPVNDEVAGIRQLAPLIPRSETGAILRQRERETAAAGNDSDDDTFVDAEEDTIMQDDLAATAFAQSPVIDMTDNVEDDEDDAKSNAKSHPDLFAIAFGQKVAQKDDEDGEAKECNNDNTIQHDEGCKDTRRRLSTPPLPDPDLIVTGSTTKKFSPTTTTGRKFVDKEEGRIREGPDIDRDLSQGLRNHWRFHDRVAHLIPRLNAPDFDWSRRYWIAVLNHEKVAKNAKSEKDFVWMKGNRLSTGKTIWHRYVETAAADPDTTVLMLGHERLEMTDTMEECDFFGDRLVVLRAVEGPAELRNEKSLTEGLIKEVPEEIMIDDD